jgi:hypothetical protein
MGYRVEDYKPDRRGPLSILAYGEPGSGKTHLASTFPDVVFLDFDRGMKSVDSKVQRVRIEGEGSVFDTLLQVMRDAISNQGEFAAGKSLANCKSIAIDGLSALVDDFLMPELLSKAPADRRTEGPKFDEFTKLKFRLNQLGSLVKDVSLTRNVILTATATTDTDEDTKITKGGPNIQGGFRHAVGAICDEMYYLESKVINGEPKFYLYAAPFMFYRAKTRNLAKTQFENPNYAMLRANLKPEAAASVQPK